MHFDHRYRATILARTLPQYRRDFYQRLRDKLSLADVDLRLYYGKTPGNPKSDEIDLPWAVPVTQSHFTLGRRHLLFQHVPDSLYQTDLLVLVQETSMLSNLPIAIRARGRRTAVALWGHGINHQDSPRSLPNRFKHFYSTKADWWFAYTSRVATYIESFGFPREHITVVNNAIDTDQLRQWLDDVSPQQRKALKSQLGLANGPCGIFCGGMYREKQLPFLITAAELIKAALPTFHLLLLGSGPDAHIARDAASRHDWIHYIGPQFDKKRIPYFAVADVLLMPGLVGLAILDAFALRTPIITTVYPYHSPEIEYLDNHVNGIITSHDPRLYAETVVHVLRSKDVLQDLRSNGSRSANVYTIDAMTSNFATGIVSAVQTASNRR